MKDREKHLETLLVIATGLGVFFLITKRIELVFIGVSVAILGLAIPFAGKYIHLGWMGIAKVLGFINTHIILAVIFYLLLTPLAMLRRLGKKDFLQLRKKKTGSYYASREHQYGPKDMENPY